MLTKVPGFQVKGVPDIKRVLVTEESGEWVIRTDGSNLSKVLEVEALTLHEQQPTTSTKSLKPWR
jgi:hypothetical protein